MGESDEKSRVEGDMLLDFSDRMSYGDYLKLDVLLSAQKPLSDKHDEMMFIIIHHVQELWIGLCIHEISYAMRSLREDRCGLAFKALARVSRIQEQLVSAWDVLSTMTPADYLTFRDVLGGASGFQSHQYRLMEILLGARDEKMLLPHKHKPETYERLRDAFESRSLYDEAIAFLARLGFNVPDELLERDFSKAHQPSDALEQVWSDIYRASPANFDAYQLAEELIDVEDWFQQWRFRHLKTVHRIIGNKRGTGGSSGAAYLKTALERTFFPELWEVRTWL
ncbi:MAG: tryptophan 2,3-dioxygenase [Hyphomicrobiales bacterium]